MGAALVGTSDPGNNAKLPLRSIVCARLANESGWKAWIVDSVLRSQVLEELRMYGRDDFFMGDLMEFMAGALTSPSNRNHKLRYIYVNVEVRKRYPEAWRTIRCFLDMNSCRAKVALLSKQSPEVPISLWPLIMERLQQIVFCTKDNSERPTYEQKASRLFYTLREAASAISI